VEWWASNLMDMQLSYCVVREGNSILKKANEEFACQNRSRGLQKAAERWRWKIQWYFPNKVMLLLPLTLVLTESGPESVVKDSQKHLRIFLVLPLPFLEIIALPYASFV